MSTKATPAAKPAALTEEQRADLMRRATANALAYYVGHTDNSPAHLAHGNRTDWALTLPEIIGLTDAGVILYTGTTREETEPGKWDKTNVATRDKVSNETVRTWYAQLHRADAHTHHAHGLSLMGWDAGHPLTRYQPDRADCYKISTAKDPIAMATALKNKPKTTATASGSGLTREEKAALDSLTRPLIKAFRKGAKWGGALSDLTGDYTDEQITASLKRLTKDDKDGPGLIEAMSKILAS